MITIPFENLLPATPTSCTDTWTENSVPFSFDQGNCNGFDFSNGSFWSFSTEPIMNISGLGQVDRVELDVIDYCSPGCTSAEMVLAGNTVASVSNTASGQIETLVLQNPGGALDAVHFQSLEAEFLTIRIFLLSGTCSASPEIDVDDGDVMVRESCHGVILVSPNGTCFRIRVDDNGVLFTEQLTCP